MSADDSPTPCAPNKEEVKRKEHWMQLLGVRVVLPWLNSRLFHQRRWCNWHRHVPHEEALSLAQGKSFCLDNGVDPDRLSPLASSTTGLC